MTTLRASTANPLTGWRVDPNALTYVGTGLRRPECILAEPDGSLWTADARGVVHLRPDGAQRLIEGRPAKAEGGGAETLILGGSLPNGLAFDRNGDLLIANFGTDVIERMTRDGVLSTLCDGIDGQPLGKTNFVLTDSRGRIWFTVTTRQVPWTRSINERTADGYIGLIDERGARIVADGFCGTNEIHFDAEEQWLYVAETNARRISRLRVGADGSLTDREIYGPSDLGGFPDGFALDAAGNLWITLILTERLIALTPEGDVLTLLDDGQPAALAAYEAAYEQGAVTPALLGACAGTIAPLMASVTFGGPDLRTVYLGSLGGDRLPVFRSPVPGLPPAHWSNRAL
ncbi:gluconolactonase (plasmid) [Azospirillum sp. B510]|uniref:SMP-30/gluconolactonase/LRE family protein n=1 Tax=Azospirillum sp. (strain B510) TaxID=137722 RepID=UPI0001C4C8EC|nr:SMP-30/gluconolactonase/LRE family protein [Azospirillum sp. B510]BAI75669.1 gluconolactonase [Azospirillum sp. B510]